jgi:hypothetical protein
MAAACVDEGDTEGAAYLYKFADRMEQDDSDDEDSDETSESAAVHNLAAADNEFVGAFNRLAQVDAFDRGSFKERTYTKGISRHQEGVGSGIIGQNGKDSIKALKGYGRRNRR